MFDPSPAPRVFGLPPGADFAGALVAGLRRRMAGQPPEAMGRVTLYLNSAGMLARVRAAFQAGPPAFLPRLMTLAMIGDDLATGLPPALPPLRRRLELAQLVAGLMRARPDFAPGSAVFDLADSLARLMDEMQGEGVPPEALEQKGLAEDHARHWERSLDFLRIIGRWTGTQGQPDPEARQRQAVLALIDRWQVAPPTAPVLIAGSTGSRGATALLMRAVAGLPQGAVILPGFDGDMPGPAWASLTAGPVPDEDHPQYRFAPLLAGLGLTPDQVADWQEDTAPDPARNRLLSLALRPAPVTDQWLAEGEERRPELPEATRGLTLIEAKGPRAEALAIAIALRQAAGEGQRAALITPDRNLARRVTAALDRWGIRPDDSAGRPLHLSAPGRFVRHIARLIGQPLTIEALLTLLKHPLTATGAGERGPHLRHARDLELHLRRHGPPFPDAATLQLWASAAADRMGWADWLAGWITSLPQVREGPLSDVTDTLFDLAGRLAAGPGGTVGASELWQAEAGRQTLATLQGLRAEAGAGGTFTAAAFSDLIDSLLMAGSLRDSDAAHPFIAIKGIREARELDADLVILGGLNDGVWPAAAPPDPWLSRQMRLKLGLLLPERQIGLAAHDFQQAVAAPRVILSRAIRDDEAETVPSRWLDRLTNLMRGLDGDAGVLAAMRQRGQVLTGLAARLEATTAVPPARRPAPRPPVEARPKELAVTAIRTLIRDPYEIYARHILRLRPLDPILPEADPRLRGEVLHKIVEQFVAHAPDAPETADQAHARLMTVAGAVMEEDIPWPSTRRFWLARIARFADWFIGRELARAGAAVPVLLEGTGGLPLPGGAFRLTARPDRIDRAGDGRLHIYDYKSGAPPSDKQQRQFDVQLPLTAAMAERGAFEQAGVAEVSAVTFIRLGGDGEERTTERASLDLEQVWTRLLQLIARYGQRETGYIARRALFETDELRDYDHLARFGEWQMSDPSAPEDVG